MIWAAMGMATSMIGILLLQFVSAVITLGVFLAINGHLLAKNGQTVGKKIVKTQIVSNSGELVPLGPLVMKRYLPVWLLSMIPFFYIGTIFSILNALLIFRENRKCLHDDFAGTKVISLK